MHRQFLKKNSNNSFSFKFQISLPNYNQIMKDDLLFNLDHGYAEGLCRGFKSGILKAADYHNLVQCETLEGYT